LNLPLDSRARRFLDLLNATSREKASEDEVERFRRAIRGLADFAMPPPEVLRAERRMGFLRARTFSPVGVEGALPGLVYFHGGGLVAGGLESHDAICAALADAASCRVIAVDYRLGPEHRFPAAHNDAVAALKAVADAPEAWGVDPNKLAVGGDSAGGGLAAYAARCAGVALKQLFLLCPVLDPLAREPSRFEFKQGFLIEEAQMERYWALYRTVGLAPDDERVAPLRAKDFSGFPPTRIHIAEYDPLRDEGIAFGARIRDTGGQALLREHKGLIHNFYGLTAVIPRAREALQGVGEDLAQGFR
jgi:acetyl esterase/lipase